MISKDSFCKNIKKYESAMYAVAVSVVQNDTDAGEVLSESIYRAYDHLDSLKMESAFKAWILRIVHNTAVDFLRTNAKYKGLEYASLEETEKGVDLTTKLALKDAVQSLNPPYRTVVVLYYYENLSVNQIAKIMNSNATAVRQQLSRARKMLKSLLKEDFANA